MHGDMTWLAMADPIVWFFLLNVLDVVLTLYVLKHGGSEKNPLLAKWFTLDDPDVVLVRIKVVLLSFVWLAHYFGALPDWALLSLVAGYVVLALHNLNNAMKVYERTHD